MPKKNKKNLKLRELEELVRRKNKWLMLSVILSVIANIIYLATLPNRVSIPIILVLVSIVIVFYVVDLRRPEQLPQMGITSIGGGPYTVCPASETDIGWIAGNAEKVYKGLDVIPHAKMLEWYRANPNGFWVIKDKQGKRCGNLDILPLKPAVMKKFIESEIIEQEIRAEDIYSPAELNQIKSIYIESLVAIDIDNPKIGNIRALEAILKDHSNIITRLCNPVQIEQIYAIAASTSGENVLHKLNFNLYGQHKRQGNHGIYVAEGSYLWCRMKELSGV